MVPDRDLWNCLEDRLAKIDVDQIEQYAQNFLVSYAAEDWSEAYHHNYEYEIERICSAISTRLRCHFAEWVRQINVPTQTGTRVRCIDPKGSFLNFNYTNSLQKIYEISDRRILHIHGSASDPDDEIVLGHGWEPQESDLLYRSVDEGTDSRVAGGFHLIDEFLAKTYKPTQKILERNKEFFENLGSVSEVFVLGHSLSAVDWPYFKEVQRNLDPDAMWTVSYHSDKEKMVSAANDAGIVASTMRAVRLADL